MFKVGDRVEIKAFFRGASKLIGVIDEIMLGESFPYWVVFNNAQGLGIGSDGFTEDQLILIKPEVILKVYTYKGDEYV